MRHPQQAPARWTFPAHVRIREYDVRALGEAIDAGDIVVSMLPYSLHAPIARLALERGAHFICSSYLSPTLLELESMAKKQGLIVAGEMGLDPGIDHMLTHELVRRYHLEPRNDNHTLSLLSLCGGIPAVPSSFCYQFSWSPLGILKALRQPSTWLEESTECTVPAPYHAIKTVEIQGEHFEFYPNRDSLAFIDYYGLPKDRLDLFLRGSLRPHGWGTAWSSIFEQLPHLSEDDLHSMSQELYARHAYREGEHDRVVMYIALGIKDRHKRPIKTLTARLDVRGNDRHHAMTTLVCLPLLTVIEGIMEERYAPGILRPTASQDELNRWLHVLSEQNIAVHFETREGGIS